MIAVLKKELRAYFTSLIGYVFVAFFLAIIGLYFSIYNIYNAIPNFITGLQSITFVFMVMVPIITMRIMADENKQKTDQLLLTSPLSLKDIILGKYFAVLTIYGMVMLVSCIYPLCMKKYGTVNLKATYAGIFGFFLIGAAFLAIGVFVSTLTDNQLIAAVVTFLIILFSTFVDGIASLLPADNKTAWIVFSIILCIICAIMYLMMHNLVLSIGIAAIGEVILTIFYLVKPAIYDGAIVKVFSWFSIFSRYDNFASQIFDFGAVIYYVSIVIAFNFLSIQALNKRRWS